jgi:hypothetical protein
MGQGVPLCLGTGEGEAGAAGTHMLDVGLQSTAVRLPNLRTQRDRRRGQPKAMPVTLPQDAHAAWLGSDYAEACALAVPYADEGMSASD